MRTRIQQNRTFILTVVFTMVSWAMVIAMMMTPHTP